MATNAPQPTEPPPWWADFPEPQASCQRIEAAEVFELLEKDAAAPKETARDFLLVDVRRTDWEGGTVSTSLNLPAQSFYQTTATLHRLCQQAGVKRIIFYCGSSGGRGPRCAGWMQDYLNTVGDKSMSAVIMKGGIKGWQKAYGGKKMDFYDEKAWTSESK